jgi:hypothetical protein
LPDYERTIEARFESGSNNLLDSVAVSIVVGTDLALDGVERLVQRTLGDLVAALDRLPCGTITEREWGPVSCGS